MYLIVCKLNTRRSKGLNQQLFPTRNPVEGFVQPSSVLAAVKISCMLTTCPYFDNLGFKNFDAGGPQCHFITSVTIAVRIRTLSVHHLEIDLVC